MEKISSQEFDRLHEKISVIIATDRIDVELTSEEIATKILQTIFNKKN